MPQSAAYTSLNQVPAYFKSQDFLDFISSNKINGILDVGGGRYDTALDHLWEKHRVMLYVYDPFNRTRAECSEALRLFNDHWDNFEGERMVTCLNVLNVIPHRLEMIKTIEHCRSFNLPTVFQIYEGDRSGIPSTTTVQRNNRTKDYVPFLAAYYSQVSVKRNIITATP